MSIPRGTRIGAYEVRELLGTGGMGEVYRAFDTTLRRDVALKILPDAFAADAERCARFEREAQVLASLNHRSIAQIFGLEHNNGVRATAMELVDGRTLAERIGGQPIPVGEAVEIARRIADALDAAHEHGVVHRDLKPANVIVRTDGQVKVLDFGLAKSLQAEGPHAVTVASPPLTETNVVIGTTPYISPERLRGLHTDERSDIWAFDYVLYEMLSGKPGFDAGDATFRCWQPWRVTSISQTCQPIPSPAPRVSLYSNSRRCSRQEPGVVADEVFREASREPHVVVADIARSSVR